MRTLILIVTTLIFFHPSIAATLSSNFTKIDFENSCKWEKAASEEEASMGGNAVCDGLVTDDAVYPVYFAEGDLRQFLGFGQVTEPAKITGGFSQWNSINTTIEWRLENGKPFATILRWFIDNIDPDTGSADPKRRGNVLVVSTVAKSAMKDGDGLSCPVGYIDARANKDANMLATQIADDYARSFRCGEDQPRFYGIRGPNSGTPNQLADDQRRH